jgi:hypothetical protein
LLTAFAHRTTADAIFIAHHADEWQRIANQIDAAMIFTGSGEDVA